MRFSFLNLPRSAHSGAIAAGLFVVLFGAAGWLRAEDFSTQLMSATFKVIDPKSTATAFILSRPVPGKADKFDSVLVTAAHVFELTEGKEVTLQLRVKKGEGDYQKLPIKLPIRADGKPLWHKHPAADIAAIRITPPKEADIPRLSIDLLADDAAYKKFEIHPGDRLITCGFPHEVEANAAGFPLLRCGAIAAFPLLPAKTVKSYFADLNTFEGDSGSPVFMAESNRTYGGKQQPGRVQLILGMVIAQEFFDEEVKMHYGTIKDRHRLGLAVVVPAALIRETVQLVPPRP
jgi:hypothetical protein